ncbi:non-hydrolyzing UDP-N-acetylglucosamine 2-epimerase [Rosistilla oblonga]
MSSKRVLLVMGTRPEAIKMAPVVHACQRCSNIEPVVCFTGQHREMLTQVSDYFELRADVDLNLMRDNQTLAGLTARSLEGLDATISEFAPDCVVAQGDTTTVMATSMASFYRKLPFVHIEAGLRTGDLYSPWPEEFNRRIPGITAALHCAPTQGSANNLLREGVAPDSVHVTGNTVIDALMWTVERERKNDSKWRDKYKQLDDRRMVLITAHRRESFGTGFESICQAIKTLAERFQDTVFIYPVHLNPNVREPVFRLLAACKNVHLVEPAPYPEFVWLMDQADVILTDSGGVQEEAPSLQKPVVVMREMTERQEAVDAGAVMLVGTERPAIVDAVATLLTDNAAYAKCQIDKNPYGDGLAAERIVEIMLTNVLGCPAP